MSVQDHIENILNAEGQGALDAWYVAIHEHPQNAMDIHDEVVDHLVANSFMYQGESNDYVTRFRDGCSSQL